MERAGPGRQLAGLRVCLGGQSHGADYVAGRDGNDPFGDGDYYCFDLTFTPMNVVVSAGMGGSYIVGDVVASSALPSDRAAALCGKTGIDAVVYFPSGLSGFYASFN